MRLINADRLSEVLRRKFGHTEITNVIQQLIDMQETVDTSGKWMENDLIAAECNQIMEIVIRYPITIDDIEILGKFCMETAAHGERLDGFLRENYMFN